MKYLLPNRLISIVLLLVLSNWSVAIYASTKPIGKIILAVGEVVATNASGDMRKLKRRSKIFSGDTLTTKPGARCQVRFSDKSLVALPESSIFKVNEYSFTPKGDTKEKAIYSLLKGGMRTISGAIGKKNRDDYKLNTPVATIGIRGTAFNIGLITENGVQSLYGTVDSGAIVIENDRGNMQIQNGQNFQVPRNQSPRLIISLPVKFPSNSEPKDEEGSAGQDGGNSSESPDTEESTGDGEQESLTLEEGEALLAEFSDGEGVDELIDDLVGGIEDVIPDTSSTSPDPTTTTEDVVSTTGTFAPVGAAVGFSLTGSNVDGISDKNVIFYNKGSDELYIDTVGGIGNIPVAGAFYHDDCNPCAFISSAGTLVAGDTGGNGTIGVNWGRWSGNYVVTENGVPETAMGDFHYIYSPNVTPLAALQALSGSMTYNVNGNTQPTDHLGGVGTLNYIDIMFDFSGQAIQDINMSVSTPATGTITATGSALGIPMGDFLGMDGINLDSTNGISVTTGFQGTISGTFVGANAEGVITTYGFREDTTPSTKAVSGTALLTQGGV